MDKQLVETITRLVVEKLGQTEQKAPAVDLRSKEAKGTVIEPSSAGDSGGEVVFHRLTEAAGQPLKAPRREQPERKQQNSSGERSAKEEEFAQELQSKTPARIAVGRAGSRPKTATWLQFRLDHAAAVDAVYGEVPDGLLEALELFEVTTRVADKEEYILRPDLGRRLSEESKKKVLDRCKKKPTVQIMLSNGLSASAIAENAEDVYLSLVQSLNNAGLDMGTPFYVDKGRVALMDEIGELLEPEVVIYLIGERPGLVSAESLSAYVCYKPHIGTIEADRMVVSNIHKGGIPPVEAGAYLGTLIQKILTYKASGVALVEKEE